jgi:hypothetical protein
VLIALRQLPATLRGPDDDAYRGRVPERFRYLSPEAAMSLGLLLHDVNNDLVFTDIYRSAAASRQAFASKPGTLRPAYSGHGYGLAFDLDVGATLRRMGIRYVDLVDMLGDYNWHCHRRDLDDTAPEAWHFNYLGPEGSRFLAWTDPQEPVTWGAPAELRILERWGPDFHLNERQIAEGLKHAGCKDVRQFQALWDLQVDGIAGPKTQRTLAFVTAEIVVTRF